MKVLAMCAAVVCAAGAVGSAGLALGAGPEVGQLTQPAAVRPVSIPVPPPLTGTPTVEQIVVRALEAAGGQKAFDAITSRITTASETVSVGKTTSFSSSVVTTQLAPGSMVVVSSSDVGGTTRTGTDGLIAWEFTKAGGVRMLEGAEREAFNREARMLADARPDKVFVKSELQGSQRVGEHDCWVVRFTPALGEQETHWYDKAGGLLLQTRTTVDYPQRGPVEVTSKLSDYRLVDGVMLPYRVDTTFGGLPYSSVTIVERVEHNAEVDDTIFELPKDVRDVPSAPVSTESPAPEGQTESSPK